MPDYQICSYHSLKTLIVILSYQYTIFSNIGEYVQEPKYDNLDDYESMSRLKTRTLAGTIIYTSLQPERMNSERGREYFILTQQLDGTDVLLAHCEIDDEPSVVRDVCLALRHDDSSPLDCSVRITVDDQCEGTGWIHFSKNSVECHGWNRIQGVVDEQMQHSGGVPWLQAHPIVGDALLMKCFDLSKGVKTQHIRDVFLTSPDHRGATGPSLFNTEFDLVYVGEEELTVGAGTFNARHFQVTGTAGNLPEEHPPYDVWCTADDDYLFLKAQAGGYMRTHYELTELRLP